MMIVLFSAIILFSNFSENDNSNNKEKIYTSLSEAMNEPDSVRILVLTNQTYDTILPNEIFTMHNIEELSFTGNDCDYIPSKCRNISFISDSICKLQKLTTLRLVMNGIMEIPKCFSSMHIQVLDLSDNTSIDIKGLAGMQSLSVLNLNGCGLEKFSLSQKSLENLKILGLSGNYLDESEEERIRKEFPNVKITFE